MDDSLLADLRDARRRELALVADLDSRQLVALPDRSIEPPLWELGHVGWFQERWLLRHLAGDAPLDPAADGLYDSFRIPNAARWDLGLPDRAATERYIGAVLDAVLARYGGRALTPEEAYFCWLATLHEDMHGEALVHIRHSLCYPPPRLPAGPPAAAEPDFEPHDVRVPGGVFQLGGSPAEPFVFDNEKWAHPVSVAPFRIGAAPVTNRQYRAFVEAGGYDDATLWSDEGWAWRSAAGLAAPAAWQRDGDRWTERWFDQRRLLVDELPVLHVNWFEANAYCAFADRRLPTEAEWELAAVGEATPDGRGIAATKRRFPWGDEAVDPQRANLDAWRGGLAPVGALGAGDSAFGCRQMLGNVWEWTADTFHPYPGFVVDPYATYSVPSFGAQKVLRGGCWATRGRVARPTFRNFYTPDRHNLFAGFRTVAR